MKIDIIFMLNGDQMDVRMRYFEPQNDYRYPFTGYLLLDTCCNTFGKDHHAGQRLVIEIENIVDLLFRNDERMPSGKRIDVEKSVIAFIFGYFVRRNLACNDA